MEIAIKTERRRRPDGNGFAQSRARPRTMASSGMTSVQYRGPKQSPAHQDEKDEDQKHGLHQSHEQPRERYRAAKAEEGHRQIRKGDQRPG